MATAKNVDEYIDNLVQEPTGDIIANSIVLFLLAIGFSYFLTTKGNPPFVYVLAVYPIYYLITELHKRRKSLGNQIWNILCPECDEYIPLHQFECPPPCGKEYTDRSIIEGCPDCKTRYKKEGPDAFRLVVCDNCGYELYFSEPYDFKPWSVLSKGKTWETETILASKRTLYNYYGKYLSVVGLVAIAAYALLQSGTDSWRIILILFGGIYALSIGLLFILIHKFLYGDKRRVPNPTFKRTEEPKEIYVHKDSLGTLLFFGVCTPFLFFGGTAMVYIMFIKLFYLPSGVLAEEFVTYTTFDIAWRLIFLAVTIILIVYHSRFYEEYKKIPNPRYKEKES